MSLISFFQSFIHPRTKESKLEKRCIKTHFSFVALKTLDFCKYLFATALLTVCLFCLCCDPSVAFEGSQDHFRSLQINSKHFGTCFGHFDQKRDEYNLTVANLSLSDLQHTNCSKVAILKRFYTFNRLSMFQQAKKYKDPIKLQH